MTDSFSRSHAGAEPTRTLVALLARVERGSKAALCVYLVRYRDRFFCELRVEETGSTGQWSSKANRVAVRLHEIDAVVTALESATDHVPPASEGST